MYINRNGSRCGTYTVEYYSAVKKNEILPLATTWVDLGIITPSEINQRKRNVVLYHLHVESKVKVRVKSLSRVWLFATPWTVAHQAPPSMGFSRQGYWSGLPFPSPGDLPNPGIKPRSPALQADALLSEPPGPKYFYCTISIPKILPVILWVSVS